MLLPPFLILMNSEMPDGSLQAFGLRLEIHDVLMHFIQGSAFNGFFESQDRCLYLIGVLPNTREFGPQAYDHLIEAVRLFPQIVSLSKIRPYGEVPFGDRLEDAPKTVEGTSNAMRDLNRVQGEQDKHDEHGWPDARVKGQE